MILKDRHPAYGPKEDDRPIQGPRNRNISDVKADIKENKRKQRELRDKIRRDNREKKRIKHQGVQDRALEYKEIAHEKQKIKNRKDLEMIKQDKKEQRFLNRSFSKSAAGLDSARNMKHKFNKLSHAYRNIKTDPFHKINVMSSMPDLGNSKFDIKVKMPTMKSVYPKCMNFNDKYYYKDTINKSFGSFNKLCIGSQMGNRNINFGRKKRWKKRYKLDKSRRNVRFKNNNSRGYKKRRRSKRR